MASSGSNARGGGRGGRGGRGRGRGEASGIVRDLYGSGLETSGVRQELLAMGFTKARVSQLLKAHGQAVERSADAFPPLVESSVAEIDMRSDTGSDESFEEDEGGSSLEDAPRSARMIFEQRRRHSRKMPPRPADALLAQKFAEAPARSSAGELGAFDGEGDADISSGDDLSESDLGVVDDVSDEDVELEDDEPPRPGTYSEDEESCKDSVSDGEYSETNASAADADDEFDDTSSDSGQSSGPDPEPVDAGIARKRPAATQISLTLRKRPAAAAPPGPVADAADSEGDRKSVV